MYTVNKFHVVPALPERLEPLRKLAYNVWWTWNHDAIELFRRLDRELWETAGHNPVRVLGAITQERLEDLAEDEGFLSHLDRVYSTYQQYVKLPGWFQKTYPTWEGFQIGYFSLEFGLSECLPIYSGGLGVLAGDHLKSASDLGIPIVGVGLLYQQGYFSQYLNADGWQQEEYPENDFYTMPVTLVRDDSGHPLTLGVDLPGRTVTVRLWKCEVGLVTLYLLDTNLSVNTAEDRRITAQLYGGDREMRIQQEIVLGIGGLRALLELGIAPYVFHLNEGHSAFLAMERIRYVMKLYDVDFDTAVEATAAGNVFTTHTPVPAGIDMFSPKLMRRYFESYCEQMGVSFEQFLAFGRMNPSDDNEHFSMAVFALRMSRYANGVSKLHGKVSRKMWQANWPKVPLDEIPIDSITNGVHIRSWISREMAGLLDRYLGSRWTLESHDTKLWERVVKIPDEELWRTHERRRERLVAYCRRSLKKQLVRRGSPKHEVDLASEVLDPEALTIGFARRFAIYKRATLLFKDIERLTAILMDKERPVQLIFAGKAHPADEPGKRLIREIIHILAENGLRRRIVFLEDYNMSVARYLVQGVDVWLNTPRRPLEASGTSGMKAAANGVLNLSILDGWWDEGYQPSEGWAIGSGEEYDDRSYQDYVESNALYNLLENEVVPVFYRRGADDLPREWIRMMKSAMGNQVPFFNTNRMLMEYWERCYMPAAERLQIFRDNDAAVGKALADWKKRVKSKWSSVWIGDVAHETDHDIKVGSELTVQGTIHLGELIPRDVVVELYHGIVDAKGHIQSGTTYPMVVIDELGDGSYRYEGSIPCRMSGRHGYTIRVTPHHEQTSSPFETRLITWS